MKRVWIWCCLVVFLLAGCGGAASSKGALAPSSQGGSANSASSAAPEMDLEPASPSAAAEASPPTAGASPMSNDAIARTAPAPEPRDRPGLGTQWGETRTSEVQDVTFTRAERCRPHARLWHPPGRRVGRLGRRPRGPCRRSSPRTPPDTGCAYVVIMHLSPEHESYLAALLQRHTSMPVRQVQGPHRGPPGPRLRHPPGADTSPWPTAIST